MLREELEELGNMYCRHRPGARILDIDEKSENITFIFCGSLLTIKAEKLKNLFGLKNNVLTVC